MSDAIPANPYTRKPISRRNLLVGRSGELAELEYYFRLTAAGQSPHIALIGARGVGKSSLLQTSREIARDLSLLPVSIDMNDKKATSQGSFWRVPPTQDVVEIRK
jgi:ABC-type phosphate/phosphonate transport system ATPase subunit